MGEEVIVVEDYMLQEIDTCKYYLSEQEFEDAMLNLEQHKPKFINVGKPVEFVTIKRRVLDYACNFNEFGVVAAAGTSCSSSAYKETPALCTNNRLSALHAISEYYDRRGLKRKLGFAGVGKDEDLRQCSRKKIVIDDDEEDTYNLNLLADVCCSIDSQDDFKPKPKPRVIRLKVIPPSAKNCSEITKIKSRTAMKIKKTKINYDVPKVDKLPPAYLEKIRKLNNGRNEQLIAQKQLTLSDIRPNLGRLLINRKNTKEFLTEDEDKKIRRKEFIKAKLLEPTDRVQDIRLTNWDMESNSYYIWLNTWNELVASNGFRVNDVIQVWTFRFDDDQVTNHLGIAIVRIFTTPTESTTTSGSTGEGNGTGCLCSS